MNTLWLIAGGSTLVYAGLAMIMGVLPGISLSQTLPGPGVVPLTPIEVEGRDVYVANGCSYCHTQQVRPLAQDKQFGRPSAPGDFAYQTPELLGSERTGPDLTNIGIRQPSAAWQYIHLYNPRAVVSDSIMPSFEWMFEVVDVAPEGITEVALPKAFAPLHGVVIPGEEARALLAYLQSLKQMPLPGADAAPIGNDLDLEAQPAEPATATSDAAAPAAPTAGDYDAAAGERLFVANCSGCHQATGEGLPETFPPLKDNSAVNDDDATEHIHTVLFGLEDAAVDGFAYESPMPAFGDMLSDAEVANIVNYERSSWGNHGRLITAADVAAVRATPK